MATWLCLTSASADQQVSIQPHEPRRRPLPDGSSPVASVRHAPAAVRGARGVRMAAASHGASTLRRMLPPLPRNCAPSSHLATDSRHPVRRWRLPDDSREMMDFAPIRIDDRKPGTDESFLYRRKGIGPSSGGWWTILPICHRIGRPAHEVRAPVRRARDRRNPATPAPCHAVPVPPSFPAAPVELIGGVSPLAHRSSRRRMANSSLRARISRCSTVLSARRRAATPTR